MTSSLLPPNLQCPPRKARRREFWVRNFGVFSYITGCMWGGAVRLYAIHLCSMSLYQQSYPLVLYQLSRIELQNISPKRPYLRSYKMAPRGKKHELGMLKMEEKAHILAWKEEGVSSVEIAKRLQRHKSSNDRLVAKAKNYPRLVTPPRKKGTGGV
jgi:hypothetical protein